jgi:hypothetical protein
MNKIRQQMRSEYHEDDKVLHGDMAGMEPHQTWPAVMKELEHRGMRLAILTVILIAAAIAAMIFDQH